MRSFLLFAFCALFYSVSCLAQRESMELTTGRIGPFKIGMTKSDAQKLTKQNLYINRKEDEVFNAVITYKGEVIELAFYSGYDYPNTDYRGKDVINSIRTTSAKFRTQKGMGVGSTRYELLNAYKDYPSFEISSTFDKPKKRIETSYFSLKNNDGLRTVLSFKMVNNIVTEVYVYMDFGEG